MYASGCVNINCITGRCTSKEGTLIFYSSEEGKNTVLSAFNRGERPVVVTYIEDNIHSVTFSYLNESGNWSAIGYTQFGIFAYITQFDTNLLTNGTYDIKVKAEDRNLYMDEEVITVTILHGG